MTREAPQPPMPIPACYVQNHNDRREAARVEERNHADPLLDGTHLTGAIAADLVTRTLADLPHRRDHSLAVGQKAQHLATLLRPAGKEYLVPAAYLHDIGYAGKAKQVGLHQIDGARFLRGQGADDTLTSLVAWHSYAEFETANRGYMAELEAEFDAPQGDMRDILGLLTYCDMTTSASGEPVTVAERFAGIYSRYEPGHLVERSMRSAEPLVRALVDSIEDRMASAVVR